MNGEVMAVGRKFEETFQKALRIDIKEPDDEVKRKNLMSVYITS